MTWINKKIRHLGWIGGGIKLFLSLYNTMCFPLKILEIVFNIMLVEKKTLDSQIRNNDWNNIKLWKKIESYLSKISKF